MDIFQEPLTNIYLVTFRDNYFLENQFSKNTSVVASLNTTVQYNSILNLC